MPATGGAVIAILAAGQSRRFGGCKLSAPFRGKPLGRWAIDAALATGLPVGWVCTPSSCWIAGTDCETLVNPAAADDGMGGSLSIAAQWALAREATALLVMLGDMPLVPAGLLLQLLDAGAPSACAYPGGEPGVPALLPASTCRGLVTSAGEVGARMLLRSIHALATVSPPAEFLRDVDTVDDLDALKAPMRRAESP